MHHQNFHVHTHPPKMSNLKIFFWNSDGIKKKLNELRSLALLQKIDIILLNETRLSLSTKLHIPNYFTYRNDLPPVRGSPAHGGTAILIHRRIVHQQITLNTTLQTSSVLIKLNDLEVLVSAVYNPSSAVLTTYDLDLLTRRLIIHNNITILAGDFNAKHPL